MIEYTIRSCKDHRRCWIIREWDGTQYVMYMHLTALFSEAISVVDRALRRKERERREI